jgi:hypothetical protein
VCVVGVVWSLSADLHLWLVKAGDSNLAAVLALNAYSAWQIVLTVAFDAGPCRSAGCMQ